MGEKNNNVFILIGKKMKCFKCFPILFPYWSVFENLSHSEFENWYFLLQKLNPSLGTSGLASNWNPSSPASGTIFGSSATFVNKNIKIIPRDKKIKSIIKSIPPLRKSTVRLCRKPVCKCQHFHGFAMFQFCPILIYFLNEQSNLIIENSQNLKSIKTILPPHSSIKEATESRSGPGAAIRRIFEIPSRTTWIT